MSPKLKITLIVIIAVIIAGAGSILLYRFFSAPSSDGQAVHGSAPISPQQEVNALTIYDWWTSPSESTAITALVGVFEAQYPNVAVIAAPVTGGAGFNMIPIVQSLVAAGQAPDAFQMHAGYEARPYFDAGLLSQIDDIWDSQGLKQVMPSIIQQMCQFDGHFYSVPVDVHRSNVIWYNKVVLDKYHIDPATLTTWNALFAAAAKLQANGMPAPIQMGESWTAAQVFETIVAGEGSDFYQDWINGKVTSPSDPKLVDALQTFKKYLSYTNQDSGTVTWNTAVDRVVQGQGAFNLMGDWADGEFKLTGMKYGQGYGDIIAPGTQGMYGMVMDTFQHPEGTSHPTNSDRWLEVVASRAGQDAFNPPKGSISPRSDSDATKYDAYQQSAMMDFKSAAHYFPSVANGSGAPQSFELPFITIMGNFVADRNITEAADAITSTTLKVLPDYNRVWSL
jgi:glucose/mannose transport system substrate-binding protein